MIRDIQFDVVPGIAMDVYYPHGALVEKKTDYVSAFAEYLTYFTERTDTQCLLCPDRPNVARDDADAHFSSLHVYALLSITPRVLRRYALETRFPENMFAFRNHILVVLGSATPFPPLSVCHRVFTYELSGGISCRVCPTVAVYQNTENVIHFGFAEHSCDPVSVKYELPHMSVFHPNELLLYFRYLFPEVDDMPRVGYELQTIRPELVQGLITGNNYAVSPSQCLPEHTDVFLEQFLDKLQGHSPEGIRRIFTPIAKLGMDSVFNFALDYSALEVREAPGDMAHPIAPQAAHEECVCAGLTRFDQTFKSLFLADSHTPGVEFYPSSSIVAPVVTVDLNNLDVYFSGTEPLTIEGLNTQITLAHACVACTYGGVYRALISPTVFRKTGIECIVAGMWEDVPLYSQVETKQNVLRGLGLDGTKYVTPYEAIDALVRQIFPQIIETGRHLSEVQFRPDFAMSGVTFSDKGLAMRFFSMTKDGMNAQAFYMHMKSLVHALVQNCETALTRQAEADMVHLLKGEALVGPWFARSCASHPRSRVKLNVIGDTGSPMADVLTGVYEKKQICPHGPLFSRAQQCLATLQHMLKIPLSWGLVNALEKRKIACENYQLCAFTVSTLSEEQLNVALAEYGLKITAKTESLCAALSSLVRADIQSLLVNASDSENIACVERGFNVSVAILSVNTNDDIVVIRPPVRQRGARFFLSLDGCMYVLEDSFGQTSGNEDLEYVPRESVGPGILTELVGDVIGIDQQLYAQTLDDFNLPAVQDELAVQAVQGRKDMLNVLVRELIQNTVGIAEAPITMAEIHADIPTAIHGPPVFPTIEVTAASPVKKRKLPQSKSKNTAGFFPDKVKTAKRWEETTGVPGEDRPRCASRSRSISASQSRGSRYRRA